MKKLIVLLNKWRLKSQSLANTEYLFHWTGITRLGDSKYGTITAKNRKDVQQKLRAQSVIIQSIRRSYRWSRALNPIDLTQMLQQLATLIHANISLAQAITLLSSCQTHPKMIHLLTTVHADIESGCDFSEALQRHARYFDPLVCALLALGEQSGTLASILKQIAQHQMKNHALKQQFITLLIYPLSVLIVAGIVSLHLLLTVIPQFQTLFQNFQATLPPSTRALLSLSHGVKIYGSTIFILTVATLMVIKTLYRHVARVQHAWDRKLPHLPGIGRLYQAQYFARSFHALAIAHQASLPITDALQWVARIAGNCCYQQAFLQVCHALIQGDSMQTAVYQTKLFPQWVVHMLHLGEETGTLQARLMDVTHFYTQQIDQAVQRLSRYIEPMLMIVLGFIIGGLIIAMYLPMIQLGALI
ncbi:MAG: type II secretion system F family protein [Gammaproteobacteria bacterium]|nr:type II secretion system F family protein [Gammaproteobacteria bacterium]